MITPGGVLLILGIASGASGAMAGGTFLYQGLMNIDTIPPPAIEEEIQDPEVQEPETQEPEIDDPEIDDPEIQDPEIDDPEPADFCPPGHEPREVIIFQPGGQGEEIRALVCADN